MSNQKDPRYVINLNAVTFKCFEKLYWLDKTFVGTPEYLGLAYFWAYEYRHYLRDCTMAQRKRIHKLWLKHNLDLEGVSDEHLLLIGKVLDGKRLSSGFVCSVNQACFNQGVKPTDVLAEIDQQKELADEYLTKNIQAMKAAVKEVA